MQVIILGDPHIGKSIALGKAGIGSTLNSRVVDQLALLDWTLDQATDRFIDNIIITGDVFEDAKPHPVLITNFLAWLKKCQAYNVNVHIIMGNHDLLRSGTVFTSSLDIISEVELDNVSVHKYTSTIVIGRAAFTLLPFRDRKSFGLDSNANALDVIRNGLVYELSSIPLTYKKMLVGHLAIEGSIPVGDEIDDMTNELFCPLDMFNGYDCVWMGHVHKAQVMQKNKPYIAHTGSMDISNFGETDQKKSIIIVDCDSPDHHFDIEYLPTRPLRKFSIVVPKDTEDPTSFVIDEIKKAELDLNRAISRVEVSLAVPELKSVNKTIIEKYLAEQGVFNITGITETKKVSLIKNSTTNTIDTKMEVGSAIKTYADTQVDATARDAFIELAVEIYRDYKIEAKE